MTAQAERRPFARAVPRRIGAFARPHRRRVAQFVVEGVLTALLAVATPVLAGRVVDAIVSHGDRGTVVRPSVLLALIALAEAALGLLGRGLSATLGEGLILDLRTTVFDHVQRMPVAFFTRTRTRALVSRLNNDVIGAQRAFGHTLSGVAGKVVTPLLTFALTGRVAERGGHAELPASGARYPEPYRTRFDRTFSPTGPRTGRAGAAARTRPETGTEAVARTAGPVAVGVRPAMTVA